MKGKVMAACNAIGSRSDSNAKASKRQLSYNYNACHILQTEF